ncbi:hypothetical protein Tco_1073077 [Tanacetum coccineum]
MMVQALEELGEEPITDEAANEEHVPTHSNDPFLSGEDRLQLKELLELCTKLSARVLDLENTKTSQDAEITKLKERVKKLERRNKSRTPGLKRLRKGRKIADLDADAEVTLVDETLIEIKAAKHKAITNAATTTTTVVTRPKARGVVVQEPSEFRTTTSSSQTSQLPQAKDKGTELEQERIKKQKIDDDQEEAEMKKHMEIVVDEEEIVVDAITLATKPPIIIDCKIIKEGKMGYFQLIRADGSSRRYSSMIKMLQNIDREDLETLWKLVKAKHGNTRPEEAYERVL